MNRCPDCGWVPDAETPSGAFERHLQGLDAQRLECSRQDIDALVATRDRDQRDTTWRRFLYG